MRGEHRELGTVRGFAFANGYGFVKTDAGDSDVFLNIKDVLDHGIPRIGDRVELTVEKLGDGRRRSRNVRIIERAP